MNSTALEITFLDGIVSREWCPHGNPYRALRGYIQTARMRRWDAGVDVPRVVAYAYDLLGSLE